MSENLNILFVGESCIVHTAESKGANLFTYSRYSEPMQIMKEVIKSKGHNVTHIPCHNVPWEFPNEINELAKYDVIVYSDVGSDTMLIHPDTMRFGKRTPNKLTLTADYVKQGGGFVMIGGYMTFAGIEGKARYNNTIIEEILPVNISPFDDRVEVPEGADLFVDSNCHEIVHTLPEAWPYILGYNRVTAKEHGKVIVQYKNDPILAAGEYGKGRSVAYTPDCTPHWAPEEMYRWKHYATLWDRILRWAAGRKL